MTKDEKVADAYASITEAHEQFVCFLTALNDIDLEIPELGKIAGNLGRLMAQAQKSLENF